MYVECGHSGPRTDVWGFAACILHLATGQLPYQGSNPMQIASMILKYPLKVPATLPGWLQQTLQQCLSFDTAARPSVAELLQVFRRHYCNSHVLVSQSYCRARRQPKLLLSAETRICEQPWKVSEHCSTLLHSHTVVLTKCMFSARITTTLVDVSAPNCKHGGCLTNNTDGRLAHKNYMEGSCVCSISLFELFISIPPALQVFQEQVDQQIGIADEATAVSKGERMSVSSMASRMINLLHFLPSPGTLNSSVYRLACFCTGPFAGLVAQLQSDVTAQQQQAALEIELLMNGSSANRRAMIASGLVPMLVALMRSGQTDVQKTAVRMVCRLASFSPRSRDAIIAAGAVPLLVSLLRSGQPVVQRATADGLTNLAKGSHLAQRAIIASGAVPLLISLLGSERPGVQGLAATAVGSLASACRQSRDASIAAGVVPLLVSLLSSDQPSNA